MQTSQSRGQRRWCVLGIAATVLALSACGGGGGGSTAQSGDLVAAMSNGSSLTSGYIATMLANSSTSFSAPVTPQYDVAYYALTYRTADPSGELVTASGLLLVPQKSGSSSPLLSLQHGTIETQDWVPSTFPSGYTAYSYDIEAAILAASLGYVVVMPDYLGYGVSAGRFHPYVQADTLASSTIDMLRAARVELQRLNVPTNGQLFLAGYSEGGYATMATQRAMETDYPDEFTLTASEMGSGPYDLSTNTDTIMAQADLSGVTETDYLAFVVTAYDYYANTPSALADYFTSTALNCVNNDYSEGRYGVSASGVPFATCLNTTATAEVINPALITAYRNDDPSVAALRRHFVDNDVYDWKPQAPTRLFYSPIDEAVPAANSTTAYDTMVANGSSSVDAVQCTITNSQSIHVDCMVPYYEDLLTHFNLYAQDL